ncbi:MAG: DUF4041 domain-containing protein [Candidatus Riflebacteria bacterium]|nr:DUF4041 domain-containing protein [Candidatus Riflebacteria bacterium]
MSKFEVIFLILCSILVFIIRYFRQKGIETNKALQRSNDANANLKKQIKLLNDKYAIVINVELERDRIVNELIKLKSEKVIFEKNFQENKENLLQKYAVAKKKSDQLQYQVSLFEETLEMADYGIYKPHYDFSDSEAYKKELENIRESERRLIKEDKAVKCLIEWTVGNSKAEGKKMTKQFHKLMMRAFNGECDAALVKVRWDNISKMEERLKKALEGVNKSGETNQSFITQEYFLLKLKELELTYELQEKIKQEKEEQKVIQEQMREEEKERREIERAKMEAEKEETRFQKALEKAREEMAKVKGAKLDELNDKILHLEEQLSKAQAQKERAISQAQLTKAGHVYVISNIGSFGEDVYKIGMTRRLEPRDRVRELGDASVPFEFDVHAMIYSENAPELERRLQKEFASRQLNLMNPRKEFFYVSLEEIEEWGRRENYPIQISKIAEARSYRESMAIRERGDAEKAGSEIRKELEKENDLFYEENTD